MAWTGDKNNPVPNIGNVSSDLSQAVAQESSNLSEKNTSVNRAQQVRRDTDKQKNNTVRLIDIDTAIMNQLEKFQLTVTDEGNQIKVPMYYASPEKWKAIQKDGIIRDYNGKMILPAIAFQRTISEKDQAMMMFNRYLNYPVLRQYSEKNRYTRFSTLVNQNVPVHEVYDVLMPDHMVFTYHFIIWTEYVEQMNALVERLNFEAEDYWGDVRGLRFRTKIDSFSHTIELQVDQDRMVKTEFDLLVNGYLLPDINYGLTTGNKITTQKWFIPKKVIMGVEVVSTGFDWNTVKSNADKWRSQKYPNLPKLEVDAIIPPYVVFPIVPWTTPAGQVVGIWHLPAPANSSDFGEEGWVSYDDDYYYIYIRGKWKRAPKVQVNAISTVVGEKKWTSYDNDYIYISGSLDKIPMSLFNNF
jgi:hypothetical protein